eukprot:6446148-Amphidinium_carterae.1
MRQYMMCENSWCTYLLQRFDSRPASRTQRVTHASTLHSAYMLSVLTILHNMHDVMQASVRSTVHPSGPSPDSKTCLQRRISWKTL